MDNCDLPCSHPLFENCFCCEARDTCPVGKLEVENERIKNEKKKKLWENVSLDTIQ